MHPLKQRNRTPAGQLRGIHKRIMYLPRQPRGVLVPDPVLWKGEILMSTYEEMQILLTFALLVVAILNLKHK